MVEAKDPKTCSFFLWHPRGGQGKNVGCDCVRQHESHAINEDAAKSYRSIARYLSKLLERVR